MVKKNILDLLCRQSVTINNKRNLALLEFSSVFIDLVTHTSFADSEIFSKCFVRIAMQDHDTSKKILIHSFTTLSDLPSSVQGGHPLQTGQQPCFGSTEVRCILCPFFCNSLNRLLPGFPVGTNHSVADTGFTIQFNDVTTSFVFLVCVRSRFFLGVEVCKVPDTCPGLTHNLIHNLSLSGLVPCRKVSRKTLVCLKNRPVSYRTPLLYYNNFLQSRTFLLILGKILHYRTQCGIIRHTEKR